MSYYTDIKSYCCELKEDFSRLYTKYTPAQFRDTALSSLVIAILVTLGVFLLMNAVTSMIFGTVAAYIGAKQNKVGLERLGYLIIMIDIAVTVVQSLGIASFLF